MGSLPSEVLLIIILVIIALAGGLTVWLVSYVSGGGKRKRRVVSPGDPAPSPVGEKELLRVSRTKGGVIVVSVQGHPYRHLSEIADLHVGQETAEAIHAIRAFTKGWAPAPEQEEPQPPSAPSSAPLATPAPSSSRNRQSVPVSKPPAREPSSLLSPLNFVQEIDNLVQQKVQTRPDLADRFIHLEAGPSGGLRIYIDRQVFHAVGDVSDPQIRAIIQEAIREWEGG